MTEEKSLQISSIDTIELNNMLNGAHKKNKGTSGRVEKVMLQSKMEPEPEDLSKLKISSVSSIDFNDNLGDAHYNNRDLMRPVHFPKKSQMQVKSTEEQKFVSTRVTVPNREVDHNFDDKEGDRIETDSDFGSGRKHRQNNTRSNKRFKSVKWASGLQH